MAGRPHRKTRPRQVRSADRLWRALAEVGNVGPTTVEAAASARAALSTAKHHLMRWRREGLVTMDGGQAGHPATWVKTSTIGPLAPLCHGTLCGGEGHSDPNPPGGQK